MSTTLDGLKRAIRADGRSHRQIALAARVSETAVCRLLSGERGIGIESAESLARVLGLEITIGPAASAKPTKSKGR